MFVRRSMLNASATPRSFCIVSALLASFTRRSSFVLRSSAFSSSSSCLADSSDLSLANSAVREDSTSAKGLCPTTSVLLLPVSAAEAVGVVGSPPCLLVSNDPAPSSSSSPEARSSVSHAPAGAASCGLGTFAGASAGDAASRSARIRSSCNDIVSTPLRRRSASVTASRRRSCSARRAGNSSTYGANCGISWDSSNTSASSCRNESRSCRNVPTSA
ncbi:hypothetical protein Vretimale_3856, partial [Volvox reticuliferus]